MQSVITTLFCYCVEDLLRFSQDVRKMSYKLSNGLGFSVIPRDAFPCNSTVIVFNAYGAVDDDVLASICGAMAVDDGVYSSSAEPDASGNLHIRPD